MDSVCSYNYVNLSFFEITDRLLLLRRCTETAQKIHTYRKLIHTLYKGVIDLLCKNGSRYQVNDLPALLHGFKRRTKRNLCLAYPTSPHTRRSMILVLSISFLVSSIAAS